MKKLTNKKGFTLMEMIIVVAIVAILAVITIPTLTGNTDKAKKSADEANIRSAKAVYQVEFMNYTGDEKTILDGQFFDPETGKFGTASVEVGQCKNHKDAALQVVSGSVKWVGTGVTTQDCAE